MIFSRDLVVFSALKGKCLETGEMTKSLENNDYFNGFGRFSCFQKGKCLETGKRQNPLVVQNHSAQGAPNDLEYGRGVTENEVSRNRKTTKSFDGAKPFCTGGTERPFRCLDILPTHHSFYLSQG